MVISRIARGIRQSGVRLGPLDAAFTGWDYYDGKQQGEDDIRAAAGAAGSTLGGWGGAIAGAKLGTAIGTVGGPVGMAIGGTLGTIGGGLVGGFGAGWGADRADELLRGNAGIKNNKDKNMATFNQQGYLQDDYGNPIFDDYGNPITQNNYQENTYGLGDAALTAGGLGLLAYGTKQLPNSLKEVRAINPNIVYKTARNVAGMGRGQAAAFAAKQEVGNLFKAARNLPGWAKVAAVAGGTILGNQALGNPLGKLADTVTGQRTNFDNDPVDAARARQNEQYQKQLEAEQKQIAIQQQQQNKIGDGRIQRSQQITNNFAGRKLPPAFSNNPYDELMRQMAQEYEQKALDRKDYEYERGFNDSAYVAERSKQMAREDYLTATRAEQARSLVDAYVNAIPNSVANQMRVVFGARY